MRWKLVSTAPLPAAGAGRLLPEGTDAEVVVLDPRTEDAATEAVRAADIVIGDFLFEVPISRRVVDAMERCRLIQQPSAGYQQIDVAAAASRGIPVANAAGVNDVPVAEHTVAVAVALMRELPVVDREVRSGEWSQLTRQHSELAGKTWGIVGFGRIGKHVARRLTGWDVDVVYYDTGRAEPDEERALDATWAELDDLLARADVVSLHVPLVDATTGLLDDARLRLMKPTAYLVNVSRGGVVDEPALVDALQHQRLRGAALDVFAEEPLPSAHAFTGLDNVILTPHSAGTVMEAQIRIMELVAANVGRVVRGEPPIDVVNGVEPAIGNATT